MEDSGLQLGGKGAIKRGDGKKKWAISLTVLVVGLIALVAGVVFLIVRLNQAPAVQDGEYLVSAAEWMLDDGNQLCSTGSPSVCSNKVVWKFTEIGKGTLTTDGHVNDYDFIWSLEDGKLLIETDWLYTLDNEYEYELDQGEGVLTLTSGKEAYKFVAKFEN